MPSFRDRLVATLHAIEPILGVEGVMIVGSEVPNLLEAGARATLVVSQDVDVLVPLAHHGAVRDRLSALPPALEPSAEEPSVWLPRSESMIELNFLGQDPTLTDPSESYPFGDEKLPLMVFGALAWLRPGTPVDVDGVSVPVPRPAGLLLEKLVSDRTGLKGDRDLLVALGLLLVCRPDDLEEAEALFRGLPHEAQHVIRTNLGILALLPSSPGVPDPRPHRALVAAFLARLGATT